MRPRVCYKHLVSNEKEWSNCFATFFFLNVFWIIAENSCTFQFVLDEVTAWKGAICRALFTDCFCSIKRARQSPKFLSSCLKPVSTFRRLLQKGNGLREDTKEYEPGVPLLAWLSPSRIYHRNKLS